MTAKGSRTVPQRTPSTLPELVRAQMDRILTSPSFAQAESLVRLLRYLTEETLAGRTGHIKEYTLGVEVFQRGAAFDPRIDTIVRTQVRRLRAKLAHYYSEEGSQDKIEIELPKGTYVPLFMERRVEERPSREWVPAAGKLVAILAGACVLALVFAVAVQQPAGSNAGLGTSVRYGQDANPQVYRLYLKGRLGLKTAESLPYLERALHLDPGFAPAWMGKAELYLNQSWNAGSAPSVVLPHAREAAMRVIELGYDVAAAHIVLATVAAVHDWDWKGAEREYVRALELDPHHGWARLQYAQLLAQRGRISEAIEQVQRIGPIDPKAPPLASGPAAIYYFARQYDRVIEHCKAVLEASPEIRDCQYWMGRAFLSKGMPAEAAAALERRRPSAGQGFGSAIAALLAAGKGGEAVRLRREVERRAAHAYVSPVSLAQVYFAFGESDAGFRALKRAVEMRDQSLPTLKVEPAYDRIRSDPRFQTLLQKLRL